MRISGCYCADADPCRETVADMAALFGLADRGAPPAQDAAALPADGMLISSAADGPALTLRLLFRQADGAPATAARRVAIPRPGDGCRGEGGRLVRLALLELMSAVLGVAPPPWGILRGVRPTKLIHRLLDAGMDTDAAAAGMTRLYAVHPAKAALAAAVAVRQRPFLAAAPPRLVSVYIGIPYCPSRCLYCSFPANVLPARRADLEAFLEALAADIRAAASLFAAHGLAAETVYIGGGTPTSLPDADFAALLRLARDAFVGPATREFTVEAGRPDSVSPAKIAALQAMGVTRVSVNPQTMREKTLRLIGRNHSVRDIIEMFSKIREAKIPVINMDIIAGLPGETPADFAATVDRLAGLAPDNLTVHTLALKKGSLLKTAQEKYPLPGEAEAAAMLAAAAAGARRMGLEPYYLYRQKYMAGNLENVGYAKPGRECIYNIKIIEERQTVIGIGPAAATKAVRSDRRLKSCYNPKDVPTYITRLPLYAGRREQLLTDLFDREEE